MVDQPVAVLARFDLPVPEQVIEVPKISCSPRFSRTVLRSPRMAEPLVEVPVPSCDQYTHMAHFRDDAGHGWCLITGPQGVLVVAGRDRPRAGRDPAGDHRQPRAVFKYWARLTLFLRLSIWLLLV